MKNKKELPVAEKLVYWIIGIISLFSMIAFLIALAKEVHKV